MPAFSHCFLKRFMAFSNDSPSLTRTPGILRITTFRPAQDLAPRGRPPAKTRQYRRRRVSVKPTCAPNATHLHQAKPRITFTLETRGNDRNAAVRCAARLRDEARLQSF